MVGCGEPVMSKRVVSCDGKCRACMVLCGRGSKSEEYPARGTTGGERSGAASPLCRPAGPWRSRLRGSETIVFEFSPDPQGLQRRRKPLRVACLWAGTSSESAQTTPRANEPAPEHFTNLRERTRRGQ
jgi:hypothetical protein